MGIPFVFMDLRTSDLDRSRDFYGRMFGWTVGGPEGVPMFVDGEQPWGGLTVLPADDGRTTQWIPYAPVADLDKAVGEATALGATVVRPRVDLPQGSVVVIDDPEGATLALWQDR